MNFFVKRLCEDVPMLTMERLMFMAGRTYSEHDVKMAEHPVFKQMRGSLKPEMEKRGDMAIVPVEGTLAYAPDLGEMLYDGVEDSRAVLTMLNQAGSDPEVRGVLLRMNTPGGMMMGGLEMGDAVASMKTKKPVVTHIGGMGASLGYLIASQSTAIVANRSSIVGSIGVISSVVDYSELLQKLGIKYEYFTNKEAKFKAAGAVGTSLSDEQRSYFQERVDSAFSAFKSMVGRARPQVKAETMQGQVLRGEEARGAGLVDAVGTESAAIALLRRCMDSMT